MTFRAQVLLFCLLTEMARASFSGKWVGTAVLKIPDGSKLQCTDLKMELKEDPKNWGVVSGRMNCSPYKVKFKPYLLQIEGSELVSNGKVFGSIKEDLVQIQYVNEKDVQIQAHIQTTKGELFYSETETSPSGRLLWSTEAILQTDLDPEQCIKNSQEIDRF